MERCARLKIIEARLLPLTPSPLWVDMDPVGILQMEILWPASMKDAPPYM